MADNCFADGIFKQLLPGSRVVVEDVSCSNANAAIISEEVFYSSEFLTTLVIRLGNRMKGTVCDSQVSYWST
jgi:hypothetical protein